MSDVAIDQPVAIDFREPNSMRAWLVTADNIERVAEWCGAKVRDHRDGPWIDFASIQGDGIAVVGEYVIEGHRYFGVSPEYFAEHYVVRFAEGAR